jgi:hypothetical protein
MSQPRFCHPKPPHANRQVTRNVILATVCIVAGCVLLVSFGDHSSSVYAAHDLLAFYAE